MVVTYGGSVVLRASIKRILERYNELTETHVVRSCTDGENVERTQIFGNLSVFEGVSPRLHQRSSENRVQNGTKKNVVCS